MGYINNWRKPQKNKTDMQQNNSRNDDSTVDCPRRIEKSMNRLIKTSKQT